MSRAPFNVLVLPYHVDHSGTRFCIFKRSDMNIWQFIAGGGDNGEQPLVAAKRETIEEAGIISANFFKLTSMCYVAANQFSERAQREWGEEIVVIPVFSFAVKCDNVTSISLSREHLAYKWCYYSVAYELLHFDLDKTALYELDERIKRNAF